MAVEVASRAYLFYKVKKGSTQASCDGLPNSGQPARVCKLFLANYIHDLESIWWIAVWILYRFQKAEEKQNTLRQMSSKELVLDLGSLESLKNFLLFDVMFFNYCDHL